MTLQIYCGSGLAREGVITLNISID